MLSTLDMSILEILYGDARTTAEDIATMTGHDLDEIRQSIARLEREKIILKYPALINWDKTTTERVEAIIEVRVTPQRDQGFDAIASRIYRYEEVRSVYLMSGGYDLAVTIKGTNLRDVAMFVTDRLAPLGGVLSTTTHFILHRYKEKDKMFLKNTDERSLVSP